MRITDELKERVLDRSNGKCYYCHKLLSLANHGKYGHRGAWHFDHKKPRAEGGTDDFSNLVAACVDCNLNKSDGSPRGFRYATRVERYERRDIAIKNDLRHIAIPLGLLGVFGIRCIVDWTHKKELRDGAAINDGHFQSRPGVKPGLPWPGIIALGLVLIIIIAIINSHKTT